MSHLTRHVFRRLLANEPIVHRECLRRRTYATLRPGAVALGEMQQSRPPCVRPAQRRSFFNMNMFRTTKREIKDADMDPGLDKMMELEKMQRMRARLPSPESVAKALKSFFTAKKGQRAAIEDTQAQLALSSLKYCIACQREQAAGVDAAASSPLLPDAFFCTAATTLNRRPKDVSSAHVELAKAIYEAILDVAPRHVKHGLEAYCNMLCLQGTPHLARDLLQQRMGVPSAEEQHPTSDARESPDTEMSSQSAQDGAEDPSGPNLTRSWLRVLDGFAIQQNEPEVLRTLSTMRQWGFDKHRDTLGTMLGFYVAQNNMLEIKKWWGMYMHAGPYDSPNPSEMATSGVVVHQLLQWCLQSKNLEFGHEVVRDIMQTNPPKPVWDAIFVWAAGTGKGIDEIGRMIDVMQRSNDSIQERENWREPDTSTINALVEFAISKGDPYMAERFIALGRDRRIEPDARTYVLQIDYRLSVNDVDGALTAYKNLQAMDLSSDEDVPAVNKLLVALCSSKGHDFDTVMNVAADLSDRRARFAPLTVSKLSLLHLDRDELHDVIDLLNTHSYHYSSAERASIRDTIVSYCLNPATPTSRSWDAYTILRQIFDELPREPRTELMTNFFTRERPDMAVHVFNHMRVHSRPDTMPIISTYVAAFTGAAKVHDLESLEVLHNQLKLDYNIDVTTVLRNSLLLAYIACGRPRKALQFWDDIVASKEGPSYNSIHIALRACERSAFGDLKANEIWKRLRKANVEIDGSMWASYIAALAGNGDTDMAIRTLEEAEENGEVQVDAFMLGSLFMAAPGMVKQGEVEAWGKARYAGVWAQLEGLGVRENEAGDRWFDIDRSVTP